MPNEKRLIYANALVKRLKELSKKHPAFAAAFAWVETLIYQTPTVDAVEVVHGRWISVYEHDEEEGSTWVGRYSCSVCEGTVEWPIGSSYNYCPHCGAKMDGESSLDCKHCVECSKNAIGEKIAYCELWDAWRNVTLGDCFGNCEAQEIFEGDFCSYGERKEDNA